MATFPKGRRSLLLCAGGILLLCAAKGNAFGVGAHRPSTLSSGSNPGRSTSAISAESSTAHALQRVWDDLVDGAELQDVEKLLVGVEAGLFPQASAWAKTWTPMRCVVAEVADRRSISVLVLPREYSIASPPKDADRYNPSLPTLYTPLTQYHRYKVRAYVRFHAPP